MLKNFNAAMSHFNVSTGKKEIKHKTSSVINVMILFTLSFTSGCSSMGGPLSAMRQNSLEQNAV